MKFIPEHIIHSNRQMMFVSNNKIEQKSQPLTMGHKVCTISNSFFFSCNSDSKIQWKNYFIPHMCRSIACQPPFNKHFPTAKCYLHI